MVCYKEGHFTYEDSLQQPRKKAKMQALRSGHIAIDLASDRSTHVEESCQLVEGPPTIFPMRPSVMMMSRQPDLSDRLQILAQRLQALQSRREPRSHGEQEQEFSQEGASSSRGRPETTGVSLLGQTQSRPCEGQPVCQLEQLQPMRVEIDNMEGNFRQMGPEPQVIRIAMVGQEVQVALLFWRSAKTPRQCLGSNGAEVQSITEGEDVCFRFRALLAEINGREIPRNGIHEMVKECTHGALVMDSKGIYDAMVRNLSSLHGLRSGRGGYELAIAVQQSKQIQTSLRWVNGDMQLGDSLTKFGSRKVMLRFLSGNQNWKLVHDPEFVAGKKIKKRELEQKLKDSEDQFVALVAEMARRNRWPWDDEVSKELRSMGDVSSPYQHVMKMSCERNLRWALWSQRCLSAARVGSKAW